ncbi:Hypothetical predicted protein [Pelobates cultripes]|uniref:Zinc finger B-box domain containing n=1 Tax=Pelobates cultripes TaxID=61616 RepID=A0AAD1VTI9_PELCU|nr:Hypothetical predicted protein [Pelobates cultripes]
MNSDFAVHPSTKNGNSVKLKAKNVREIHVENIQLEIQNQEMEQKLNQLRQMMSKEKEERERSNGYHWKSGQVGNQNQDKENVVKVSSGKIKLKVLKNPLPEPVKQKTVSRSAVTVEAEKPKIKGKVCGQCEMKSALLVVARCGEDYCPGCFAKIHQKGALKLHRSMPIQGKSQDGKLDVSREPKIQLNCEESREKLASDKDFSRDMVSAGISPSVLKQNANEKQAFNSASKQHVPSGGGLLLNGMFDEDESSKSFSEALMEWRNDQQAIHRIKPILEMDTDNTGNSEAQTTMTTLTKPVELKFKEDGINYLEKLMLKKYRRTPVNYVASTSLDKRRYSSTPVSVHDLNDYDGLTAEEIEDHEHYVALFKPEKHVTNNGMHEPAVKIVELDEPPEEDLEETRACSVSEVERKEVKNQQSFQSTEYPKSTPVCTMLLDCMPIQAVNKGGNTPLQSTYSVQSKSVSSSSEDKMVIPADNKKASLLKDSKSMKYKTSNDNQRLKSASVVNLTTEFENIALRERNALLEYHGFKGFFTLGVDPKEVKADLRPLNSYEQYEEGNKIISAGNSYWRPESSLSDYADDNIVHEIVEKAQAQNPKGFVDHSLSPRPFSRTLMQRPLTGSYSERHYSRTSESHSISRPSTATARPLSRAACEISEIEYIDTTYIDDPLSEKSEEQETLTDLGKEFDLMRCRSDNKEGLHLTKVNKILTDAGTKAPLKTDQPRKSSPVHSMKSWQSCDGESDSYEDEEDLQDKLHVLSLQ